MDYRNACAVNKTYARTYSETCEPQNHCKSHKAAQHALHKVVIGECAWKGLANVDTRIRDNNV